METLPNNIEKLIENLPVITLDNDQEFQKIITSTEFTQIFNFYKENYLPDILKPKSEIYQRISLYLTITGQGEQFTEQTDQVLYRRPVPTIEEFLDGSRYLGLQNQNMFSYWRKQLLHIFGENSSINRVLWSGATGTGKALSNDTIIPTPNGKKRVDEIKQGDYLWGKNGKPTKVIGVYPQGKLDTYKITFDDNSSVICSGNHIWHIEKNKKFGIKEQDLTTLDLIHNKLTIKYPSEKIARYKYKISLPEPIAYETKKLPIHPYVLGFMLGDGYFGKTCIITSNDTDFVNKKINMFLYPDFKLNRYDKLHYGILKLNSLKSFKTLCEELKLYKVTAKNKFIPEIYKESNIEQRYMLLKGLLDSDGTIQVGKNRKASSVMFGTTSERLANDICEIVRSLGGRANL